VIFTETWVYTALILSNIGIYVTGINDSTLIYLFQNYSIFKKAWLLFLPGLFNTSVFIFLSELLKEHFTAEYSTQLFPKAISQIVQNQFFETPINMRQEWQCITLWSSLIMQFHRVLSVQGEFLF
jgi:hypothetical protein